jgi:hypothetical protein
MDTLRRVIQFMSTKAALLAAKIMQDWSPLIDEVEDGVLGDDPEDIDQYEQLKLFP